MYEILDVGCGEKPTGDVNVDLLEYAEKKYKITNVKKIKNFVNCDAHNLPFRDNSISTIRLHHVIEHLENPLQALREVQRVAKKGCIIHVPNYPLEKETKYHLYSWNKWTLKNLLERAGFQKVTIYEGTETQVYGKRLTLIRKHKLLTPFLVWYTSYIKKNLKDEIQAICEK